MRIFFRFFHTSTFQLLLDKPWPQASSLLPPPRFLRSIFIAHTKCSAAPLLVDFSSSVANSRSRAFRKSQFVHKKKPCLFFFSHTSAFQLLDMPWSQMSSLLPPGSYSQFFFAHRVQQSHCSSIFHRVLLTDALTLFRKSICAQENVPDEFMRVCTRGGFELTKLTYTRLEDNNLIRHRGDRLYMA